MGCAVCLASSRIDDNTDGALRSNPLRRHKSFKPSKTRTDAPSAAAAAPTATGTESHRPARPRLKASGSAGDPVEDTLSDISMSIVGKSNANDSFCTSGIVGASMKFKDDIEQQRQNVSLSIDEDLFVYDDVAVSKNDAQAKHWRIEGRQPLLVMRRASLQDDKSTRFFFTDFNVCVDEVDLAIEPDDAGGGRGLSINYDTTCSKLQGSRVTRTYPITPNTVAARERLDRDMLLLLCVPRPLRRFDVRTLIGHAARVKCISIAPNEASFATCSCEGASVTLHNIHNGREFDILTGHRDTVICTAFSPDGKLIATTSKDHSMILWDATVAKLLYEFAHNRVVICCCFSPDSRLLVSGCQDRVCRVWDVRIAREVQSYAHHEGIVVSVAYSPNGTYCCSASADRTLRMWSTSTGKTRLTMLGHTGIILACSFTSDGAHVVSNDEVFVIVWCADDGTCRQRIAVTEIAGAPQTGVKGPKLGWTVSITAPGAFLDYLVAACTNRFVYIIDLKTGSEVTSTFCKAPVYSLASGTMNLVMFGDSFGNLYVQTLS